MKKIFFIFLLLYGNIAFGQFQRDTLLQKRHYPTSDSLLLRLNSYFSGSALEVYPSMFSEKRNVTDSIKRKLMALLKYDRTESEIKVMTEREFKENFEFGYFNSIKDNSHLLASEVFSNRFVSLAKKRRIDTSIVFSKEYKVVYDSVYNSIYDSLATAFKKDYEARLRTNVIPIPNEIIRICGVAKVYEAIPLFKEYLASSDKRKYDVHSVKLALAAMGDKEYQNEFFELHRQRIASEFWDRNLIADDFNDMTTIGTQHSFGLLADWLDTTKKINELTDGPPHYIYSSTYAVPSFLFWLQNEDFRKAYMKYPIGYDLATRYDYFGITVEQILFVRKWMLANKGKYEID